MERTSMTTEEYADAMCLKYNKEENCYEQFNIYERYSCYFQVESIAKEAKRITVKGDKVYFEGKFSAFGMECIISYLRVWDGKDYTLGYKD